MAFRQAEGVEGEVRVRQRWRRLPRRRSVPPTHPLRILNLFYPTEFPPSRKALEALQTVTP